MLSLITLALAALVTAMDVSHDVSIYYSGSEYSELNWSIVIEEFKEYATGLLPYILGMYGRSPGHPMD